MEAFLIFQNFAFLFRPDTDQYKIPDKFLEVGLVCASLYGDGYWHRAYIKAVVDTSTVEVFYVDYCTSAKVTFIRDIFATSYNTRFD